MEFLTSISEYASIITALLMFGTTFILTFKSIREWIATGLANKVNVSKLSSDGDIYKELPYTFSTLSTNNKIKIKRLSGELSNDAFSNLFSVLNFRQTASQQESI